MMLRQSAVSGIAPRLLVAVVALSAPATALASWGVPYLPPARARSMAPDQSWLQDVPERAGRSRGKVGKIAVFTFEGDDLYQPVRAAVVKLLRRRELNVTATLRPVDSAAQYRELSQALNLAIYVEGDMRGEGARQSAVIRLRSGMSGQHIATARFVGPTTKIVGDVNRTLWTRLGPTVMRSCSSVTKPRTREREPLRIDAGSPMDSRIAGERS
jgi:hypothetical protein